MPSALLVGISWLGSPKTSAGHDDTRKQARKCHVGRGRVRESRVRQGRRGGWGLLLYALWLALVSTLQGGEEVVLVHGCPVAPAVAYHIFSDEL